MNIEREVTMLYLSHIFESCVIMGDLTIEDLEYLKRCINLWLKDKKKIRRFRKDRKWWIMKKMKKEKIDWKVLNI